MAYFRQCPADLMDNNDFIDIFFNFANTYTEDSVRTGFLKVKKDENGIENIETMRKLGYTEKDISKMLLKK